MLEIYLVTFNKEPNRNVTYFPNNTSLQGLDTILRLETSVGIYWYDFTSRGFQEHDLYGALYSGDEPQNARLITDPNFK